MPTDHIRPIRVFVSSTRKDLSEYRREALKVFDELQLDASAMENERQTGLREDPVDISETWVDKADWVVLIVGWHYGTVSQDGHGKSITEREYDRVMSRLEQQKEDVRCFVYLAGDAEDGAQAYSPEQQNQNDRLHLFGRDAYVNAMTDFRQKLRRAHAKIFTDIRHFRSLLNADLSKQKSEHLAVSSKERRYTPLVALAEKHNRVRDLLWKLRPVLDRGINDVRVLAQLKEIHEGLHWVRQEVIRPLRETILPSWPENEGMPGVVLNTYTKAITGAGRYLAKVERSLSDIIAVDGIDSGLLSRVCEGAGKGTVFGWSDGVLSKQQLSEDLEGFAPMVQEAFSMMNHVMQERKDALNAISLRVSRELNDALPRLGLDSGDQNVFRQQVEAITEAGNALVSIVNKHARWQRVHDNLEHVDATRDSPKIFSRKVKNFLNANGGMLSQIINDRSGGGLGLTIGDDLLSDCGIILAKLAELERQPDPKSEAQAYDSMRRAFDDEFFQVDLATLKSVKQSKARVENVKDQFDNFEQEMGRRFQQAGEDAPGGDSLEREPAS